MRITTLTQYKQDARTSTEKCVAVHSAAGRWREQRALDAVEHIGAFSRARLHRLAISCCGMRVSRSCCCVNTPSTSTARAHTSTEASKLRSCFMMSASDKICEQRVVELQNLGGGRQPAAALSVPSATVKTGAAHRCAVGCLCAHACPARVAHDWRLRPAPGGWRGGVNFWRTIADPLYQSYRLHCVRKLTSFRRS